MKAKTGAESPPAPSSSALAAVIDVLNDVHTLYNYETGYDERQTFDRRIKKAIATLDAQATDKAAAVEKVKAQLLRYLRWSVSPYIYISKFEPYEVRNDHTCRGYGKVSLGLQIQTPKPDEGKFDIKDYDDLLTVEWEFKVAGGRTYIANEMNKEIKKRLAILTDSQPKEEEQTG